MAPGAEHQRLHRIAPAGHDDDVDGDGLDDAIVGAGNCSNGSYQEGAAFVFLGF